MTQEGPSPTEVARELHDDIGKVRLKNTPNLRKVRKKYSKKLAHSSPKTVLDFARYFIDHFGYRWMVFEIIHSHKIAMEIIGVKELDEFGQQINSWGEVDAFAGYLAGPAWRNGKVPDELILSWAHSSDYWRRRTALVCTVALNRSSLGGRGDTDRTLKICRELASDKNDMVVKALSWALRELITHDREAVTGFLQENEAVIAARVLREVKNKLATGLKDPRRKVKGDIIEIHRRLPD
jgi:3-methyladenine DNA glycosylase AlkD